MPFRRTSQDAVKAQADEAKRISDKREQHEREVTEERLSAQRALNGKADGDK